MTIEITMNDVAHKICGELCGMVESNAGDPVKMDVTYTIFRGFTHPCGAKGIDIKGKNLSEGAWAYAGYGRPSSETTVPAFLSKDKEFAVAVYKYLIS